MLWSEHNIAVPPHTFTWMLGITLRSAVLNGKHRYLLSTVQCTFALFFERVSYVTQTDLKLYVTNQGWPWTPNPSACTFRILGLQVCITTVSCHFCCFPHLHRREGALSVSSCLLWSGFFPGIWARPSLISIIWLMSLFLVSVIQGLQIALFQDLGSHSMSPPSYLADEFVWLVKVIFSQECVFFF